VWPFTRKTRRLVKAEPDLTYFYGHKAYCVRMHYDDGSSHVHLHGDCLVPDITTFSTEAEAKECADWVMRSNGAK
jgi:hypothetical protein